MNPGATPVTARRDGVLAPWIPFAGKAQRSRDCWSCRALTQGALESGCTLEVTSEMEGGVLRGDGMESDRVLLPFGQRMTVRAGEERLRFALPGVSGREGRYGELVSASSRRARATPDA